jgi:DnaJ family protein C protein 28
MAKIDEQIRRAMEEGAFSDLPGKGKPLNLDNNPLADPEWRLAHHVLRGSGYTLPWIAARQEIEASLEKARADFRRAWEWRQEALSRGEPPQQVASEWGRAEEAFRQEVAEINKRIFDYNLQAPSEKVQLLKINVEREIERLGD